MVDPQACWPLSKALSYLHTEERCSEGLSRFDTNYGSYTHIVKEKLAEFHMTFFGPLNLKWKDPFSHDTVNFKPVHTWHHILILHLRNTFGVINNNFDVFQHNDLSLLFMFLEIEKKSKSGDRHIKILLCCIRGIFMGHFVNIEQASYNYSQI